MLHFLRVGLFVVICLLSAVLIVGAQQSEDKPYQYKLYGFVRGELYYNNRSNVEGVDGLFYLFPKDVVKDPDGADLNGYPNGSFYTFATRLGLDIKGPDIGAAKATAKIETDFGGTNNLNFVLRIRQIYLRLAWDKGSSLLLGQTWHPMFGEVMPDMLNLATGAPFQPFNRSPQINYQFNKEHFKLTASAIFQHIYLPVGPDGKTETYAKNALLPEFYLGADYRNGGFLIGSGADLLSLKPRTNATVYRVNERVTSLSYELHAKYHRDGLKLSGKTLLALNQTHNTMLGGFGVTSTDSKTGEQQYVAFKHSTTWLNVVVGKKWQTSCFAGYTKNLGTPKPLESVEKVYGTGLNIDRLLTLNLCFSYNVKHWKLGAEYTRSTAWYGKINVADGKVQDPHAAKNNRIETVFMYFF